MAKKNKGKAKRRIKNFDADRPTRQLDQLASRQSLTGRAVKIPAQRLDAPQDHLDELPKVEGMVTGRYPGGVMVRLPDKQELLCAIAKTFRAPEGATPLTIGDDVTVALTRDEHTDEASLRDKDRSDGFIIARVPRRTLLARPQPVSAKRQDDYDLPRPLKVIAANMDTLMIIAAVRKPRLSLGLIDRFLITAERGDLDALLVINKIDLAEPDDELLAGFAEREITPLLCSAETGAGLEELAQALSTRRAILAGASGVGKTTLINGLIPDTNALTRTIRKKDNRGRHTTSAAVIYDLPCGGMLVDTPGIRELAMDIPAEELPWYFPEFEPYLGLCKFNNCTHTHEPNCAVIEAIDAGEIPLKRFESYLRILESLDS
jgi:ribosome biogenesis GTPase